MLVTPTPRHWALLGYLVVAWGLAFYLIAVALPAFKPVTVVWGRLTLGGLVMLLLLTVRRGQLPRGKQWWFRMLFLSLSGNILPFTLIAWAEQTVPSGEVGLLMALMPITILVLGHWFLEHEPLTTTRLAGVALGFVGVALLLGDEVLRAGNTERLPGQLAAVAATFCYAVNGIFTKRLPPFDVVAVSAGSLCLGSALLMGPMLMTQPWVSPFDVPTAWLAVAVLGLFATGAATWVYFTIVSEVGPGFLSTINYLIPALAFGAGAWLLGEPVMAEHFVALVAIFAGVWLIQPKQRGKRKQV